MFGYEGYRDAARVAIQRFGWVPILSEDQPAQDIAPRTALLREVARADIYLLLLGSSYGASTVPSPTEEEYLEATRLGKPVIVMVEQGIDREPAQKAFIDRVSTGWSAGRYRAEFASPDALQAQIVLALRALEKEASGDDGGRAAAVAKAAGLARGAASGYGESPQARVVVVPTSEARLISSVQLNAGGIADGLAHLVRQAGLAPSLAGFSASENAGGVEIEEQNSRFTGEQLRVRVEVDGTVVVEGPICGDGQLGSMWIDPDRLSALVRAGFTVAPRIWELLEASESVRTAAIQVAIPRGGGRSYGRPSGGSFSMGGRLDGSPILAPRQPEVVSVNALSSGAPAVEILAGIERVYRDAGAVNR